MHDIKSIVDKIFAVFESHKDEEHIEMELRLGKHNGTFFDTNVGKENFERVLEGLRKYNAWEKTETTESDVYYSDNNNIRLTVK